MTSGLRVLHGIVFFNASKRDTFCDSLGIETQNANLAGSSDAL